MFARDEKRPKNVGMATSDDVACAGRLRRTRFIQPTEIGGCLVIRVQEACMRGGRKVVGGMEALHASLGVRFGPIRSLAVARKNTLTQVPR